MTNYITIPIGLLSAALLVAGGAANAVETDTSQKAVKPAITGALIRGLTLPGNGAAGTPAATSCNFMQEAVGRDGLMEDASVNYMPGGSIQQSLRGLPERFNAYCVIEPPRQLNGGHLLKAPVKGNANHYSLSDISPKDAQGQFRGALWR